MQDKHIVTSFDNDLERIQAYIMKMGGLVEASISDAADSFLLRDVELADKVRARDANIDELEALINDDAARVLALRAPTAIDLRLILSVIKVSANLERIGDYSKNMAQRTSVLLQMREIDNASSSLRRLAKEVELMLKDALDSYIQRDPERALEVIKKDKDVDQMYNGLFRQFLTFMMEDPRNITACMHLHFIAKNIERMGDHVTSIAEQVVFFTTGEPPSEPREKEDRTSHDAKMSLDIKNGP